MQQDMQNQNWSEINKQECEEASLQDMCSWAEAN